jgi:[FeFe] hydrogenase H-cluster maturation GTPase HydF
VLFIDTAGIDDEGALGELRVERTRAVFTRAELALVVAAGLWGDFEEQLLGICADRKIPAIVVINKVDAAPAPPATADLRRRGIAVVETSATAGTGLPELRQAILDHAPADFLEPRAVVADLVGPGEVAVLVVPIDKEAPKGRLILPQVQVIRDLLDHDAMCVVTKERELAAMLGRLRTPPRLVVTDSQAFLKVAADTPPAVWLTSFSILFARLKGDLLAQTAGALAIDQLRPGDRVLIAEACAHHPIGEDIGRVKIPRWLIQYVGGRLEFDTIQGHDFPSDLGRYRLIIQCGSCTLNRREVLGRLLKAREAAVPFTNYGLAIARSLGILPRALQPFPAAHALVESHEAGRHPR